MGNHTLDFTSIAPPLLRDIQNDLSTHPDLTEFRILNPEPFQELEILGPTEEGDIGRQILVYWARNYTSLNDGLEILLNNNWIEELPSRHPNVRRFVMSEQLVQQLRNR